MPQGIHIDIHENADEISAEWRLFLPDGSQAIQSFRGFADVMITGPIMQGNPPSHMDESLKAFIGSTGKWQDSQALVDVFCLLFPDVLKALAQATPDSVALVYFSGLATNGELLTLLPHLPLGLRDDKRYCIDRIYKYSRKAGPVSARVCVEYDDEEFRQMAGPDGFSFPYGSFIMGVSVAETMVEAYLGKNLRDKTTLDESLREETKGSGFGYWCCRISVAEP